MFSCKKIKIPTVFYVEDNCIIFSDQGTNRFERVYPNQYIFNVTVLLLQAVNNTDDQRVFNT